MKEDVMCDWLEPINAVLPEMLKLACPGSENFFQEISQRPWADPVPALLFIYGPAFIVTAITGILLILLIERLFDRH